MNGFIRCRTWEVVANLVQPSTQTGSIVKTNTLSFLVSFLSLSLFPFLCCSILPLCVCVGSVFCFRFWVDGRDRQNPRPAGQRHSSKKESSTVTCIATGWIWVSRIRFDRVSNNSILVERGSLTEMRQQWVSFIHHRHWRIHFSSHCVLSCYCIVLIPRFNERKLICNLMNIQWLNRGGFPWVPSITTGYAYCPHIRPDFLNSSE